MRRGGQWGGRALEGRVVNAPKIGQARCHLCVCLVALPRLLVVLVLVLVYLCCV